MSSIPKAVVIGTDEVWAAPKVVYFDLETDLSICSVSDAAWDIVDAGVVSKVALWNPPSWIKIDMHPIKVRAGETVTLRAGSIRIKVFATEVWNDLPSFGELVKASLREGVTLPNYSVLRAIGQ